MTRVDDKAMPLASHVDHAIQPLQSRQSCSQNSRNNGFMTNLSLLHVRIYTLEWAYAEHRYVCIGYCLTLCTVLIASNTPNSRGRLVYMRAHVRVSDDYDESHIANWFSAKLSSRDRLRSHVWKKERSHRVSSHSEYNPLHLGRAELYCSIQCS